MDEPATPSEWPNTVGHYARRLHPDSDNPREVAFAEAWTKANHRLGVQPPLVHLLPHGGSNEAQVAVATAMQWLGSNVGMGFLDEVIQSCPEVRKFLMHSCLSAEAREKAMTPEKRAESFNLDQALLQPWVIRTAWGVDELLTASTDAPGDMAWIDMSTVVAPTDPNQIANV